MSGHATGHADYGLKEVVLTKCNLPSQPLGAGTALMN